MSLGLTSMQIFPIRTTGQPFLHSCLHFFGLHFKGLTMAAQMECNEMNEVVSEYGGGVDV